MRVRSILLTGQKYSKSRVDRSGALWLAFARRLADDREGAFADFALEELHEAAEVIEWWRREHARPLTRVNASLRHYLRGVGESYVSQRLKRFATIVDKLGREPTMKLTRMEDIGGCRAILREQALIDAVVVRLQRRWDIHRVRDYVREPKSDGYRAVHLIVRKNERRIELQLRTPWQDLWAQSVENDTRRLRIGLKFGAGPDVLREYYGLVAEFFALRESGLQPDEGLMQRLRELHLATRPYLDVPELES